MEREKDRHINIQRDIHRERRERYTQRERERSEIDKKKVIKSRETSDRGERDLKPIMYKFVLYSNIT